MNDKAQKTVDAAESQLGSPYVFGMWGGDCTPANRRKYSGYNPSHAAAIAKNCQVLNGGAASCDGCKYQGRLAFDCRGFNYWVLMQVGIKIDGGGATSQYNNAANWVQRGTIDQLPDLPCCLFKRDSDGKTMMHTGYHIGGGQIIHCSVGVQRGKTTEKGWTHYAVPVGLYSSEELAAAGLVQLRPVLKKGSKGPAVEALQRDLKELGYDSGGIDGIFGALTAAAVRCFQSARNLTIDAVVGANTWAAIDAAMVQLMDQQEQRQDMPQDGPVWPQDGTQEEPQEEPTEEPTDQPAPAWAALVQQMRDVCAEIDRQKQKLDGLVEAAELALQKGGEG